MNIIYKTKPQKSKAKQLNTFEISNVFVLINFEYLRVVPREDLYILFWEKDLVFEEITFFSTESKIRGHNFIPLYQ